MSRLCTKRCDYHPVCPCGGKLPADVPEATGRWALFAPDERQVLELALRRHHWLDPGTQAAADRLADEIEAAGGPWDQGAPPGRVG